MVQIRGMHGDCNCKTCEGSSTPPRKDGEIVIGGWRCVCPCHNKEYEKPDTVFDKLLKKAKIKRDKNG